MSSNRAYNNIKFDSLPAQTHHNMSLVRLRQKLQTWQKARTMGHGLKFQTEDRLDRKVRLDLRSKAGMVAVKKVVNLLIKEGH